MPYMAPILVIRYAMRGRKKITGPKVMTHTPLESQKQDLPFYGSNFGKPFNEIGPNATTISWSD